MRIAPSPFGKHVERYNTSLNSPSGQKSVLKVYMDNQLDLNEEEMQYYETIVNDLAGQVEGLRVQVGALSAERDSLLASQQVLQESLNEVRTSLEDTEHELRNCHPHLEELTQENTELKLQAPAAPAPAQFATKRLPAPAHPVVSGRPPLTPQQARVNEFLGLDEGNESDPDERQDARGDEMERELEQGMEQERERSRTFESFHSTNEHVLGRSDVDELQNLVKQREQQVK